MTQSLDVLISRGTLRAAINTGNKALVQKVEGRLEGISPALAQALADELGVPLEPVVYDSAGKVVADAAADRWDVAFLAVDPERSDVVSFTEPYKLIEVTYAVRSGSPVMTAGDLDKPGSTILVSKGSAYDLRLTELLQHASLLRATSPVESMEWFFGGQADAVAGVRESLGAFFAGRNGFRILPDAIVSVGQAMAVPARHRAVIEGLDDFLKRAMSSGKLSDGVGAGDGSKA